MAKGNATKWILIILLLIGLWFLAMIFAGIVMLVFSTEGTTSFGGNVALIPVKGPIMADAPGSLFSTDTTASSTQLMKDIERASEDPTIDAIVFEINSPGGSAVASDEVAQAILAVEKPTVSYIREVGASGAYWIASATDMVFANRMSIVGSIGVIASYVQFEGMMQDYNVSYERFVAGKYKDFGTPFRSPTEEERTMFQSDLDMLHDIFISEVATNRDLSEEVVRELANGYIYLGLKARDYGLVDELGGEKEVIAYLEDELNTTVSFVHYSRKKGFLEALSEVKIQAPIVLSGTPQSQMKVYT